MPRRNDVVEMSLSSMVKYLALSIAETNEDRLLRFARSSARFGLGPAGRPRRSRRPLPLAAWMLGLGLLAIGLLAYNYWNQQYDLILALRDATPVDKVAVAEARNDILRNTLTAIAGFAAAAVLLLNFQKQRYEEYNATQQRIADLRIQAVEQLGSESPSVRIGGLHNLERLGVSHPELRQIVLDEICSYLRLDHQNFMQSRSHGAESEVRLIAQEILQRHLKFQTREQRSRYWSHTRLNLKNARLQDVDLNGCFINEASFKGAEFHGDADFRGAEFHGHATFGGAHFHASARFHGVQFHEDAVFHYALFQGRAGFGGVGSYIATQFHGDADFEGAQFHGDAEFSETYFDGMETTFIAAQFHSDVSFYLTLFRSAYTNFRAARFHRHAGFHLARLYGQVDLVEAEFQTRLEEFELPAGWRHHDRAERDGTWRLAPDRIPEQATESHAADHARGAEQEPS